MTIRSVAARVTLLALVATVLPVTSAASAATGLETFVTMFSEPGDFVGGGEDNFFFPGNASFRIEGDARVVAVHVEGGNLGSGYAFEFAAPEGERLREGEYVNAQRWPFQTAPRPGMDVSGNGRGCNELSGRFRVKRIVEGAGGAISSLWIVYEQHCENGHPALFGEVRYEVPGEGGVATVGPREVRWPDTERGSSTTKVVPVTVANPADVPLGIGASFVEGPAAADFRVRLDDCRNVTLGPRETCTVFVRYVPQDEGSRAATLVVPESTSFSHRVSLEGFAFGGTTRFVVSGDPGEPVVGPNYYDTTPGNARFVVTGDHEGVEATVLARTGEWRVEIEPPAGDVLAPGTTYVDDDPNDQFDSPSARLLVVRSGSGCTGVGDFTVSEIAVDDFGRLTRFGAAFELHCGGSLPGIYGILDFHSEHPNDPPPPFPSYRRKVTLSLGAGAVSGRVTGPGPRVCRARIQVAILVVKEDRTRLVAVARTDASGRYRRRIQRLDGYYAAFVPLKQLGDGSICGAAVSPVRTTER